MDQQELVFTSPAGRLRYLFHVPKEALGKGPIRLWPLILFLHGRGESGDDLTLLKRHGVARVVEEATDFPFATISPQCPAGTDWSEHHSSLIGLLDEVRSVHAVDPNRVYLTGLSMGGRGTWQLAVDHPEKFAAIAPVCGRVLDVADVFERLTALERLPVWAFHGAKDPVVPVENTQRIVSALRAHGSNVRLTVYPDAGHDCWTQTYANPDLYAWFLEHCR